MTGGARPIIIWVLLLSAAGVLNAVWTGDLIQIGLFAVAVLSTLGFIGFLIVSSPQAVAGGEPVPRGLEPVVRYSVAATMIGIGFAVFGFGFVFGHFIVYFGAGMVIVGVGRLLGEWRAQREARRVTAAGA